MKWVILIIAICFFTFVSVRQEEKERKRISSGIKKSGSRLRAYAKKNEKLLKILRLYETTEESIKSDNNPEIK